MSEFPLRTIQTIGLTIAGITSGASLGISVILTPRILESPTPLLLKQWKNMYDQCKLLVPGGAVLAGTTSFLLSYHMHSNASKFTPDLWKPYLISGILAISILPYTVAVIMPTNTKLMKKSDETKSLGVADQVVEVGLGGETAHALVDHWATLNLGRSALLIASTLLSAWTALA